MARVTQTSYQVFPNLSQQNVASVCVYCGSSAVACFILSDRAHQESPVKVCVWVKIDSHSIKKETICLGQNQSAINQERNNGMGGGSILKG
eukprot:5319566-Amphidinium_carterae.1